MKLFQTTRNGTKIENCRFLRWNIHHEIFLHKYYYSHEWVVDLRFPYVSFEYYMVGTKSCYEVMFCLPKINDKILNGKHIELFPTNMKTVNIINGRILSIGKNFKIESFSPVMVKKRIKISDLKKILEYDILGDRNVEEKLSISIPETIKCLFRNLDASSS